MKAGSVALLTLMVFLTVNLSADGDDLDEIRALWRAKKYDEVIDRGVDLRDRSFGKTPELDYLIGTSACRTGRGERGIAYLTWCLNYQLPEKTKEEILLAIQRCSQEFTPLEPKFYASTSPGRAGVFGSFKTYAALPDDAALNVALLETVQEIPVETIRARQVPRTEAPRALNQAVKLAGTGYSGEVYGNFVVVGKSGSVSPEVGNLLARYERFYRTEYNLSLPEVMVTVYLARDFPELRRLAAILHGIKLPEKTIAYSYQDDITIVVHHALPNNGNLCHELFHLMARSRFGDIPPWLDEGMSALYEESRIEDDRILGVENWRRKILEKNREIIPSIASLIAMDASAFNCSTNLNVELAYDVRQRQVEVQSVNEATARYFLLFLQSENKLRDVFAGFRNARPEDLKMKAGDSPAEALRKHAIAVLEKASKAESARLNRDFKEWLDLE